jgi:hypothetical protein
MCLRNALHFTPDGVSRTRAVITINMALLTEGQTTDHRLQSSDPFTISPTSNHTPLALVALCPLLFADSSYD